MTDPTPSPAAPAPKPAPAAAAPKADMTRGDFLWLGWGMLAGFFAASAAATARFFFPNVIYEPSQRFNAGPAKNFDVGVSTKFQNEQRVWIIRTEKGFYALWARRTHLGCTPNWFGDQQRFKCPCHGSNYTVEGDVIAGPAPRPLWRTKIDINSQGELVIDKAILEDLPGKRQLAPFFVAYS